MEDEENYVYSRNSHDIRNWEMFIDHSINITRCLNDEVLILEGNIEAETLDEEEFEDIEELEIKQNGNLNYYIENEYGTKCSLTKHSKIIADKINQLIKNQKKIIEKLNKNNSTQ